jgi:hypothetical protein
MTERKIYRKVVIDIFTGDTLFEDSYLYKGPMALCDDAPVPDAPQSDDITSGDPAPDTNSLSDSGGEQDSHDESLTQDDAPPPPPPKQYKYKDQDEAEKAYKELEKKLGHQGTEIGTLKQVIERLAIQQPGGNTPQDKNPETPVMDAPPVKPKIEDFDNIDKFDDAVEAWRSDMVDYRVDQKLKAKEAQSQTLTVQKKQQQQKQEVIDSHRQRIESALKTDPGLLDIIDDGNQKISDAMSWAIMMSEHGPKAIRYLYEHPDDAERIYNLAPTYRLPDGRIVPVPGKSHNPILAFMEMGKIVEKLTHQPEPKPKKASDAPAPHTPVGGNKGTGSHDDLSSLARSNPAEYLRRTGTIA